MFHTTSEWQTAAIIALLLALTVSAAHCVALLERCERHLRELHTRALGPGPWIERQRELGLDDGYPERQARLVLVWVLCFVAFYYVSKWVG